MQFSYTFSNLFFLSFKLNLILKADDNVAILETQVIASGDTVTEDRTATTELATIAVPPLAITCVLSSNLKRYANY